MDAIEEFIKRGKNDPRSTDELLEEAASAAAYKDSEDDVLSNLYWKPIRILHCRADDSVMAGAKRLLFSKHREDRVLSANILAQVALGDETRRVQAADLLLPVFERETDFEVLNAIAYAFGHIGDERSVTRLVALSSHPDESLRFAVVYGLAGQDGPQSIAALIKLSNDPDNEVRDWATFSLGTQTELDTPELKDALVARLIDSDEVTRHEAIVGLARRGDLRVVNAFLKELELFSLEILEERDLIEDAATEVVRVAKKDANKLWQPLLEKFLELKVGDSTQIQKAIEACSGI